MKCSTCGCEQEIEIDKNTILVLNGMTYIIQDIAINVPCHYDITGSISIRLLPNLKPPWPVHKKKESKE